MPKKFVALVGDLEGSRKTRDRASFSESLERYLRTINAQFADEIWAPVVTVRGLDEISGLLHRPDKAFHVCARVNELVHPARFRWGISVGAIDVGLSSRDAGAMDGPAFHNAAEAILRGEAERRTYTFYLPGLDTALAEMIETAAQLYAEVVSNWTPTVSRVIDAIRQTSSQVEAARSLKLTPQRVSQIVHRGSINRLLEFEVAIGKLLGDNAHA